MIKILEYLPNNKVKYECECGRINIVHNVYVSKRKSCGCLNRSNKGGRIENKAAVGTLRRLGTYREFARDKYGLEMCNVKRRKDI